MEGKMMRAGRRIILLVFFMSIIGGLGLVRPSWAQGRSVIVRIFAGDKFIPDPPFKDLSFHAKTFSLQKDRENMANPKLSGNAAGIIARELIRGYNPNDLADPAETKLGSYISGNVPTGICFCGGHVLLMQSLKSGPVPPMVIYADSFYPLLKRYGVKRDYDIDAEPGDVVAYFADELATVPSHVATVLIKGSSGGLIKPKVISKDAEERVYKTAVNKIWADGYKRYEIWHVKNWGKFNLQIVAGPIEFAETAVTSRVDPSAPADAKTVQYVGDTVEVKVKFKVKNPPSPLTPLKMTADARFVHSSGDLEGSDLRKFPTTTRHKDGYLEGEETFSTFVTRPGEYRLLVTLSAKQSPGSDETEAEYEPQNTAIKFTVLERPKIENFEVDVNPRRIPEGGKARVSLRYDIKGVPGPGKPALRVTRTSELIHVPEDGTGTKLRTLGKITKDYNGAVGERSVKAGGNIRNAGKAGTNTLKVTLKLEIAGRTPIEVPKECLFEVVRQ